MKDLTIEEALKKAQTLWPFQLFLTIVLNNTPRRKDYHISCIANLELIEVFNGKSFRGCIRKMTVEKMADLICPILEDSYEEKKTEQVTKGEK